MLWTMGRFFALGVVLHSTLALAPGDLTAGEAAATGRISQVTLYRGQAMVTRTIRIEGAAGASEVVVGELPEQIVPNSLFAEGNEAVEVRAARYRPRASDKEPREEVRKLDQSIEDTADKLNAGQKRREVLERKKGYLDQLEGFVVGASRSDLARGVLDANALQKMALFSFEQREKTANDLLSVEKETRELNEKINLLRRKREELTRGATHTIREAVLFIEKHGEGKSSIRLSYLVNGCGWSPSYTIRADKEAKSVHVECNALIRQLTGEEWKNVELTLSTASPALSAAGMGLAPFSVALTKRGGQPAETPNVADLSARTQAVRVAKQAAIELNRRASGLEESIGSSWAANIAANDLQNMELFYMSDSETIRAARDSANVEGPSLSYALAGSVSLASRNDQQIVRILRSKFESRFYHVATPVLTGYVYREAEMTNLGNEDLLAGPVSVYLDGRFVGHSEIPTVARGETFVVGFGADPQLRARRELVSRTEDVQGGNRELSFKYRLVLENYKAQTANLRLSDRIPHSDRPADVRIKLGELRDQLSKDELYVRTERPKGILRWDVEVPGNSIGSKVRMVEYGFTLEFDRSFSLNMPSATESKKPARQVGGDLFQDSRADGYSSDPFSISQPTAAAPNAPRPRSMPVGFGGEKSEMQRQFEMQQRAKLKH